MSRGGDVTECSPYSPLAVAWCSSVRSQPITMYISRGALGGSIYMYDKPALRHCSGAVDDHPLDSFGRGEICMKFSRGGPRNVPNLHYITVSVLSRS